MNEIITNGTEIKQRIISEISTAQQCVYLAMAWFTDRDIANALIEAKNRNVSVDIILSSNIQNETVKLMLRGANISVHAFDTGDDRGMMHHKFCLIDNRISINGSYNYSYNASNNNVENIHISDDSTIYRQLFSEFERLKYNIDNNIDINARPQISNNMPQIKSTNPIDSFSQQLHNLVYSSAQINTEGYKKRGYEESRESEGNIDIFKSEYANIKEQIRAYATDDSLSSKKNILTSSVSVAFESQKTDLENDRQNEINAAKRENDLEKRQITDKISEIRQEKSILESGNQNTGEKGLFQINKEIEKNKLEKNTLEQSFVVKKFWGTGTICVAIGLCILIFYLSIFFASAMYKMLIEENIIRTALEAGNNPGIPQIVDADAILKIFDKQVLLGIMAMFFFIVPILLSNIKIFTKNKWIYIPLFLLGLVIFDVVVAIMVDRNSNYIQSLLKGGEFQWQILQVFGHAEFWLIFMFGMFPLLITHFLIGFLIDTYRGSRKEIAATEKARKIEILDKEMIELSADKDAVSNKIKEYNDIIKENNDKMVILEKDMNNRQNQIEDKYIELLKHIKTIFDDFNAKITSGKIFTDEILNSVISAYKSGFIEYLPEYYSENEVTNRVREIEQVIINNNKIA